MHRKVLCFNDNRSVQNRLNRQRLFRESLFAFWGADRHFVNEGGKWSSRYKFCNLLIIFKRSSRSTMAVCGCIATLFNILIEFVSDCESGCAGTSGCQFGSHRQLPCRWACRSAGYCSASGRAGSCSAQAAAGADAILTRSGNRSFATADATARQPYCRQGCPGIVHLIVVITCFFLGHKRSRMVHPPWFCEHSHYWPAFYWHDIVELL